MSEPTHEKEKLSPTRAAVVHKFQVGSYKGYLTVGFFPDGRVGEIFCHISKEGSTVGGFVDTIAILTSVALQNGVPLSELVDKLSHIAFEPSGHTNNPEIRYASSIVDYIFRWLGNNYCKPNATTTGDKATPS